MKKLVNHALIALISLTLLFGCIPEPVLEIGDPPIIPPLSTFSMNFDLIPEENGRRTNQSNKAFSAAIVDAWKMMVDTTLIAPITSLEEAMKYEPTYDHSVQAWVWEYDFVVGTNIFNARLLGRANSHESRWEMLVRDAGSFIEFKWFVGQTDPDGLAGSWTVTRDAEDVDPFLKIDWNRVENNSAANIRYTDITPLSENTRSYIFYQRDDAADFDRKYLIYSKHFNNETDILWKSQYGNGQVRDFRQYNNNDFQCWDSAGEDHSCIE